jgi:hypothetical protein
MSSFLPESVRDELRAAQTRQRRKQARRVVHVGDEAFAILDFAEEGFAVDADTTPRLRGLVDIFEGPRHLYQALIVASEQEGDLMRYEFKRNTAAASAPPVDFEQSDSVPSAYLPRL